MAGILAYAETRDGKLGKPAREAVSTARAMADEAAASTAKALDDMKKEAADSTAKAMADMKKAQKEVGAAESQSQNKGKKEREHLRIISISSPSRFLEECILRWRSWWLNCRHARERRHKERLIEPVLNVGFHRAAHLSVGNVGGITV